MNGINYSYESCDYLITFQGRKISSYFIDVNDEFSNVIGYRIAFKENELFDIRRKLKKRTNRKILFI